jgi:6-phosphogluconolactonase
MAGRNVLRNMDRIAIQLSTFALCCSMCAGTAWADGAVYAMTNALGSGNNKILVYHRASNGSLSSAPVQTMATGGGGSGLQLSGVDSLGSAGSVQLDQAHHLLFAVNTETASANNGAGTYNQDCSLGTITSFLVASDGTLTFADRVYSGGLFPDSLTVKTIGTGSNSSDLLYVLNAGGPGICAIRPNVTGFSVNAAGQMSFTRSQHAIGAGPSSATSGVSCLAASATGFHNLTGAPATDFDCGLNPPSFARSPAQVRFTPDGTQLVVTVKGTNKIYVFPVDANGKIDEPQVTQAPGPALPSYFGFTFDKNENLLVTELFGTATSIPAGGMGAVSSFKINGDDRLHAISADVGDGGTAACWIALEPTAGQYAYVSNNLSASISSYAVGKHGTLTIVADSAAGVSGPNDLATAAEGGASYLYVVEGGAGNVGAFQINLTNGSLNPFAPASGLPSTAQGLAAF